MDFASVTLDKEHQRYKIQAQWTAEIRARILSELQIQDTGKMLEVGSGTGVVTSSVSSSITGATFGVDINQAASTFAASNHPGIHFAAADGHELPFKAGTFDVSFCHFLLLWVENPKDVLAEMCRTTRSGGWVIAFAEPDYSARIDFPDSLMSLGTLQTQALRNAGADPEIGRQLRALFRSSGLEAVTAGVLGGEWSSDLEQKFTRSEWDTIKSDLAGRLSTGQLRLLEETDLQAWRDQTRILFVPTFYAFGQVP